VNGYLRLLAVIVTVATAFAAAVVAVVTRTTRGEVAAIVELKQEPMRAQVGDLCKRVEKMDERQRLIAEDLAALKVGQSALERKIDRLLDPKSRR